MENKPKESVEKDHNEEDAALTDLDEPAYDVEPRGLSHGYWKDLLNLLTLAVEGSLDSNSTEFTALHHSRILKSTEGTPAARSGGRGRGLGRGMVAGNRPAGSMVEETNLPKEAKIKASEEFNAEKSKQARLARDQIGGIVSTPYSRSHQCLRLCKLCFTYFPSAWLRYPT